MSDLDRWLAHQRAAEAKHNRPLSAPWDYAIADAAEDPPGTLDEAVAQEIMMLWTDLDTAIRDTISGPHSTPGCWSIGAINTATRIIALSRFAGACPWVEVPINLTLDGTWCGLHTAAGIPHTDPTGPELDDLREMEKQLGHSPGPSGRP